MIIIFDTDILSAFAKIEALSLLKTLFSKHEIYITPEIYGELNVPIDYGYTFPLDIFKNFKVINPDNEEQETYRTLLRTNRRIGKGELEAISICISRKWIFSSMDEVAISFALANGVITISLHSILRSLWESGILAKNEVEEIILKIEQKDNTRIRDIQKILK